MKSRSKLMLILMLLAVLGISAIPSVAASYTIVANDSTNYNISNISYFGTWTQKSVDYDTGRMKATSDKPWLYNSWNLKEWLGVMFTAPESGKVHIGSDWRFQMLWIEAYSILFGTFWGKVSCSIEYQLCNSAGTVLEYHQVFLRETQGSSKPYVYIVNYYYSAESDVLFSTNLVQGLAYQARVQVTYTIQTGGFVAGGASVWGSAILDINSIIVTR